MRVPLEWLKEYVKIEATPEEIATKLTMGGLEVEGIEESDLGPVIDVYITPNRGDCLSMVGVAREVAALYGVPLHAPAPPPSSTEGPVSEQTSVTLDAPDLCPRYAARLVRGVKIGPSPAWMQARLEAAGQRAINNVVDVTNYVMLEMGQPLHAFDLDLLHEGRIVVRRALDGETILTLDGEQRVLGPNMLVIADGRRPVAIAGIMGGGDSEVSDATTNLLFESAHFNALSIRRTARALNLRTEASYRFERVVDPEGVRRAVDRACELLAAMGQPQAVEGAVDVYPEPQSPRALTLRIRRAAELLGMEIPSHMAADSLRALGFEVGTQSHGIEDALRVHVPSYRFDINIEEDLIEEVGRIHGYENIPETLPFGSTTQGGDSVQGRLITRMKRLLVECGLQEVITHSLTAAPTFDIGEEERYRVPVRNVLSTEVSGLRSSLVPTLLDVAQNNVRRGQHGLALFEIGRVWRNAGVEDGKLNPVEFVSVAGLVAGPLVEGGWQQGGKAPVADYYLLRGVLEKLFVGLEIDNVAFQRPENMSDQLQRFHPGRTSEILLAGHPTDGVLGEIHPRVATKLGLKERAYMFEISLAQVRRALPAEGPGYHVLSPFPGVSRDIAPRVLESVEFGMIAEAIRGANVDILEEFRITDLFRGAPIPEGTKSITVAFTFRASDHTLAEGEVTVALANIRSALEARCGATFAA